MLQACVGAVIALGSESHGGAVATTSASLSVVSAGSVPSQPDKDRTVRAIVVVILLLQQFRNSVVDLLVVVVGGCEETDTLTGTPFLQV